MELGNRDQFNWLHAVLFLNGAFAGGFVGRCLVAFLHVELLVVSATPYLGMDASAGGLVIVS